MSNHHMRTQCPLCSRLKDDRANFCRACSLSLGLRRRGTGNYIDRIQDGYVHTYRPEHLRADKDGYIKRATLTWEQEHERALPVGYHIHHRDNSRDNDIPDNLEAVTSSEHCKITAPWRYRK